MKCDEIEIRTIVEANRRAILPRRVDVGMRRQEGPHDRLVAVPARGEEGRQWRRRQGGMP